MCMSGLPHHAGRVTKESPPQTIVIVILIIIMANILDTFMPHTLSKILEGIMHLMLAITIRVGNICSILQISKLRHRDTKQFVKEAADPGIKPGSPAVHAHPQSRRSMPLGLQRRTAI